MLSDLMLKKQLEFWKSFVRLGGEKSLLCQKALGAFVLPTCPNMAVAFG